MFSGWRQKEKTEEKSRELKREKDSILRSSGDGGKGPPEKECSWPLWIVSSPWLDSQQRNKNLRPTASRNWILPPIRMSLDMDSSPEPPCKNLVQLTPRFWPCETLSRKPTWARLDTDLQTVSKENDLQLLNLWCFVTQKQKVNISLNLTTLCVNICLLVCLPH